MKLTMKHGHPRMCLLTRAAKVLFCDATELQYPILLMNMVSHVTIAVYHEVSQGSYVARGRPEPIMLLELPIVLSSIIPKTSLLCSKLCF